MNFGVLAGAGLDFLDFLLAMALLHPNDAAVPHDVVTTTIGTMSIDAGGKRQTIQRCLINAPNRMSLEIRVQHDAMPRSTGAIKYDPLRRPTIAH